MSILCWDGRGGGGRAGDREEGACSTEEFPCWWSGRGDTVVGGEVDSRITAQVDSWARTANPSEDVPDGKLGNVEVWAHFKYVSTLLVFIRHSNTVPMPAFPADYK